MSQQLYDTPDSIGTGDYFRIVALPTDTEVWGLITAALHPLTQAENWEQVGSSTPEECAEYFEQWLLDFLNSTTPF